jgi:hypothetical protein
MPPARIFGIQARKKFWLSSLCINIRGYLFELTGRLIQLVCLDNSKQSLWKRIVTLLQHSFTALLTEVKRRMRLLSLRVNSYRSISPI